MKLNIFKLRPARDQMHMSIVKPRQQQLAASVDPSGCGAAPSFDLGVGTDGRDTIPENRNRLSRGPRWVDGPHLGINDDEIRGGFRLGEKVADENQEQEPTGEAVGGKYAWVPINRCRRPTFVPTSAWCAVRQKTFRARAAASPGARICGRANDRHPAWAYPVDRPRSGKLRLRRS